MTKLQNNKIFRAQAFKACALLIIFHSTFIAQPITTQFIQETKEDIREAQVNIPERVPVGPDVFTRAGEQLSPGTTHQDLAINQEIYNDLSLLQGLMSVLMRFVLNVGIAPTNLAQAELQMRELITFIRKIAIRYRFENDFFNKIKQLTGIMIEIKNAPKNADYMLFKARLEVILSEIENALYTRLVLS